MNAMWQTQGVCARCGERVPVKGSAQYREHAARCYPEKSWRLWVSRQLPDGMDDYLYPITVVGRALGFKESVVHADLDEKRRLHGVHRVPLGKGTITVVSFGDVLQKAMEPHPFTELWNPFQTWTETRVFMILEDAEQAHYRDSRPFARFWKQQNSRNEGGT